MLDEETVLLLRGDLLRTFVSIVENDEPRSCERLQAAFEALLMTAALVFLNARGDDPDPDVVGLLANAASNAMNDFEMEGGNACGTST
jgi:hypothetical protein